MSGWGSYRQCDTERDHFPLESWRFLQIISYCLLISVLSMTWLSSGDVCNQIQPAVEVAVQLLCSRGLVFWVCLLGKYIYQHEVFRLSQAHTLLAWSLGSQSFPQLSCYSFPLNSQSALFCWALCTLNLRVTGSLVPSNTGCIFCCQGCSESYGQRTKPSRQWASSFIVS